nr:carbohydrate-binding family 9-like protein [uncultured Mucilaginibacter sp.]
MKHFISHTLPVNIANNGMKSVSEFLDGQAWQLIGEAPWHTGGHLPEASFSLAHNRQGLYLKYRVREQHILARYKEINDPVYQDSCVEFFIAFAGDNSYYNLEFNCIGTPLVGYGQEKNDRVAIPNDILKEIKVWSIIQEPTAEAPLYHWELTLFVPFFIFAHHHLNDLTGQTCRVNFYKCGDELPEPHFLSWAPIEHPYAEFHLPEFFGSVAFV